MHSLSLDSADSNSVKSITTAEAVSSILVPLPYVLASLAFGVLLTSQSKESDLPQPSQLHPHAGHEWPLVCSLTSVTLVAVGLKGKVWNPSASLDRRKKSLGGIEEVEKSKLADIARRIAGRILTVGLPFYATSKLGAARVGLVMLAGLASNILAIEDEATDLTRIQGWRCLLTHRRWTIGAIFFQLACDLTGFTNESGSINILLGYVALGLSVLVLAPPFPSARPKMSVVASSTPASESKTSAVLVTPREAPPQLAPRSPKMHKLSPLTSSPQDVNLTLLSGIALGIVSLIIPFFFSPDGESFSSGQIYWEILSGCAAALVLTTAEPKSLRSNKGLGLVLGSLVSSFLLTQLGGSLWRSFAYQSILVGISFAALKRDTHTASSISSRSNHHHHHHHHPAKLHSIEHGQMSRFSAFLIQSVPPWPLFHSILVEKDSRRIFYFMWYGQLFHFFDCGC